MKTGQTHTVLSSAASHCGDADSVVILDTLKYRTDITFEILSVCSPKMVCNMSRLPAATVMLARYTNENDAGAGAVLSQLIIAHYHNWKWSTSVANRGE